MNLLPSFDHFLISCHSSLSDVSDLYKGGEERDHLGAVPRCSVKKVFLKFRKNHWEIPVSESFLNKIAG